MRIKNILCGLAAVMISFNTFAAVSQNYVKGGLSLLRGGGAIDITMAQTVGTLTQGQAYRLTWNDGSFLLTRLADGYSASYSNADLTQATVSLWWAVATIIPNQNSPSLLSASGVIAKITNWPDDWYGSGGATWYNYETTARANAGNFNTGLNNCSNPLYCLYYKYFYGTLQNWVDQNGTGMSNATLVPLLNSLY